MTDETQPNIKKIANPKRIVRMLKKISKVDLPVFIRIPASRVLIKARAAGLILDETTDSVQPVGFFLNILSKKAVSMLDSAQDVGLEFVALSSKFTANVSVLERKSSSVVVSLPPVLQSVERRFQVRFPVTPRYQPFVSFPEEILNPFGLPPIVSVVEPPSRLFALDDISASGISFSSHFPAPFKVFDFGMPIDRCTLHPPLATSLDLKIVVRWKKKVVEHSLHKEHGPRTVFRFGCSFEELTYETKLRINAMIQNLNQSQGV